MRTMVNVPPFMVVSAAECQRVFRRIETTSGQSVSKWIEEDGSLAEFRSELAHAPLSEDAREEIAVFVRPGARYAVRSSASVEDGKDSAFAGHFLTQLNVEGDPAKVIYAVRECWLSCVQDSVRDAYAKLGISEPSMSVVIMEQLDSDVSGVLFQANPVTGAATTTVINATYGQGDGVVGARVPMDELWVNTATRAVTRQVVADKVRKVTLDLENGGTKVEDVPEDQRSVRCLTERQLTWLLDASAKISQAFKSPQDIEFAFARDQLYILQSRPITARQESLDWDPPDVGLWRLNAHIGRPMCKIYESIWLRGWSEGCLYNSDLTGSGFTAVDTCSLNGFGYFVLRSPGPKAPPKAAPPKWVMRTALWLTGGKAARQATAFWTEKKYLEFLREWDSSIKPGWVAKHRALYGKDMSKMSAFQLAEHLQHCHDHLDAAWYAHCTYTMQNLLPIGLFAARATAWATDKGLVTAELAYSAIEGFSPITSGLHGEFPEITTALAKDKAAREILMRELTGPDDSDKAQAALDSLKQLPDPVGEQARQLLGDLEPRLVDGYEPVNPTLKEFPSLLFGALHRAVKYHEGHADSASAQAAADEAAQKIRAVVPPQHHAEFDQLLAEARQVSRLRDERAVYVDLTAAGILRLAMLEAGQRIAEENARLERPELALDATLEELKAVLVEPSRATNASLFTEWENREKWRHTATIRDAPVLIGGNDIEIDESYFPNKVRIWISLCPVLCGDPCLILVRMRKKQLHCTTTQFMGRSFAGTIAATRAISTPNDMEEQYMSASAEDEGSIWGIAAGARKDVEGPAVVVRGAQDLARVVKGSVVILDAPSSLIALVSDVSAAFVCDNGGVLSHAAICAREAGIPCVVGCRIACNTIRTGDTVRVAGSKGAVKVIQAGGGSAAV